MTTRANLDAAVSKPGQALVDYGNTVEAMGLERNITRLVELRASQINGCFGCISWHIREARAAGETEDRIHQLNAWRESPLYSDRERAAIAWTEALTKLDRRDMKEAFALVAAQFTPDERIRLNLAVGVINDFNRVNIANRFEAAPAVAPATADAGGAA